ncbi:hypothetical protein ACFVWN_07180 [Nocardiopsis flavescens]|uniref:hypothetical protein n=1 Tax=Nocardiopsis flavescens TaxID=758803 RepID=UPI00365CA69C
MNGPGQAHADLLARLEPDHRVRRGDRPLHGCAFLLLVVPAALVAGLLLGLVLADLAGAALRRAAFAEEGVPVRATVLETTATRLKVVFTTADGATVTTWAEGEYRPHPEHAVPLVHLAGDPAVARAADHAPRPGWPLPAACCVLASAALFSLHHRLGFRAGWFVRRLRVHVRGPAERPRPVVPLLVTAAVLAALAAVPAVLVPAADRTAVISGQGYTALAAAPPLLLCAVAALVRAALRYAEDRPLTRLPRPFRPLPRGTARTALALSAAAALTALALYGSPAPVSRPVPGTAEVVGVVAGDGRPRLELRYEADGIVHHRSVEVGRGAGEGLLEDGTVAIVWDADDPGRVRLR